MVACLGVLSLAVALKTRPPVDSIRLQALDQQGQLEIQWDPSAGPIRQAVGAKLYITDGAERLFVKLSPDRLQRGTVRYARRSQRVELHLALNGPDGKLVEEFATFVEPARPAQQWQAQRATGEPSLPAPAPVLAPSQPVPGTTEAELDPLPVPADHRARTKHIVQSGTRLPFTCSTGDVFHKTDAPAGFDTFGCRGRNVWTLLKNQASGENRSASETTPNATNAIAKPAIASSI
jgi:hypothetical protein